MAAVATLVNDYLVEGSSNVLRTLWDRLSAVPGGKRVFSAMIGRAAPYTGSIGAQVVELTVGRSVCVLRDRREVRNHLRCIHAIALSNLAELAGNVALAYSLPDDARFIIAGIQIDYDKKARGTVRAVGSCPPISGAAKREYPVTVEIFDEDGDRVARASMRTLVGPKKRSA